MLQKMMNKLNDLRPKQLLMLAGAAGVLMFITLIVGMNLLSKDEVVILPEEKPVIQTTAVVVAKTNIPPRTRIQESMLQMKEMPVDMVPEGAITDFDSVKNVQVKVSIFAGDILTIQKVFNSTGDEGFVGSIPPDCRAVSINVNEITGVAGFAKPGDKVDLLYVEKGQYSATANILLQNVSLLSVNQDTTGGNIVDDNGIVTSSAISNPTIATFALPPQDVLKLVSASKLGEIYMMLRPANPRSTYVEAMEYTTESVNTPQPEPVYEPNPTPVIPNNPIPENPMPIIPTPQLPTTPKIEIIMGDEVVQRSENTAPSSPTVPVNQNYAGNTPLPVIPSNPTFTPPPVPNTPLSNSNIMNNIGN